MLHQAGPAEFTRLADLPRHPRHALVPFIARVDEAMAGASLVLSRSGASTCAELKAAGRGSVLVPLPTSANDHQRQNAQAMVAEGRARLVEQGEGFTAHLEEALRGLLNSASEREALSLLPEPNRAVAQCLDDLEGL